MAYSGRWRDAAVTPEEYASATRWGTGYNPVHALPDTHKPTTTREPLGSTAWSGAPPEAILGPSQWGYSVEDQALYGGEDYRYLEQDHPNWGENEAGRPDRDGRIMEVGEYPQPEGWPSWGPYNASDPDFPLSGPPGGADVRAFSDQLELERGRAIAVPTQGYTGGWQSKIHSQVNEANTSDPAQYEINTSMNQLHRSMDNNRATGRATDASRTPIETRLTGMKVKLFAKDINMGGGPGTPDMSQLLQDLPYRPFFFRRGATPPMEAHTWNEISYNTPLERVLPEDAGAYVTVNSTDLTDSNYGYTTEDGGYY